MLLLETPVVLPCRIARVISLDHPVAVPAGSSAAPGTSFGGSFIQAGQVEHALTWRLQASELVIQDVGAGGLEDFLTIVFPEKLLQQVVVSDHNSKLCL